jgi:hypothetical protein
MRDIEIDRERDERHEAQTAPDTAAPQLDPVRFATRTDRIPGGKMIGGALLTRAGAEVAKVSRSLSSRRLASASRRCFSSRSWDCAIGEHGLPGDHSMVKRLTAPLR